MPKINSLEVVHQDTNKDSYQTLHDILVDLKKSLALNQELVDGDARVAIENLLEMYVNDKEAFLRSLQTLTAQFKNSEAKYEEEILLQASALEALAKRTTTLTAQTDNNLASVKEYSEAVANEVDRKVSTYSQDEPPTDNLTYGDLWYDTNDNNRLYRWNGIVWVDTSDTSSLESFIAGQYATDYAAIESQVDSKTETWFQTSDPSTAWTTTEVRNQHDKDLWYNSSTKLLKVYTASTNTWTTIEDQAAVNAAAAASTAQSTADGKIVTFIQTSAPTASAIGDLWMDSDDNRKMYRWNGSSWVAVDDSRIANTYSRWGVQTTAIGGGKTAVAGIQLNSDSTGTSEFTVLADNFRVYKSGYTSSPMFSVGTVNGTTTVAINGNLVVDGTITTKGVADNAISNSAVSTSATAYYLPTTKTTLLTCSITLSVPGWIYASSSIAQNYVATSNSYQELEIQGNQVSFTYGLQGSLSASGAIYMGTAGTYTITLSGWADLGSSVSLGRRTLYAVGLKK